jgi:hypothetical protein
MKTYLLKVDMDTGASLSEDCGDLSWNDAKLTMRTVQDELKFYKKKPTKPRAVRVGSVRFIIVGFRNS